MLSFGKQRDFTVSEIRVSSKVSEVVRWIFFPFLSSILCGWRFSGCIYSLYFYLRIQGRFFCHTLCVLITFVLVNQIVYGSFGLTFIKFKVSHYTKQTSLQEVAYGCEGCAAKLKKSISSCILLEARLFG